MQYCQAVKCYIAVKMNKLLLYASTWMNLKIISQKHNTEWAKSKKNTYKLELLYTACGNVKWWSHYGKQCAGSCLPYELAITLWVYIQKNWYQDFEKISTLPRFAVTLFTIAKIWKQPECPSMVEWRNKMWCLHPMEPSLKKGRNPATFNKMAESWGHYAKWNKPLTKGQVCMSPLIWRI